MKQLAILGPGDKDGPPRNTVGSSLDHLIGTWSDAEAEEFERALRHLESYRPPESCTHISGPPAAGVASP